MDWVIIDFFRFMLKHKGRLVLVDERRTAFRLDDFGRITCLDIEANINQLWICKYGLFTTKVDLGMLNS